MRTRCAFRVDIREAVDAYSAWLVQHPRSRRRRARRPSASPAGPRATSTSALVAAARPARARRREPLAAAALARALALAGERTDPGRARPQRRRVAHESPERVALSVAFDAKQMRYQTNRICDRTRGTRHARRPPFRCWRCFMPSPKTFALVCARAGDLRRAALPSPPMAISTRASASTASRTCRPTSSTRRSCSRSPRRSCSPTARSCSAAASMRRPTVPFEQEYRVMLARLQRRRHASTRRSATARSRASSSSDNLVAAEPHGRHRIDAACSTTARSSPSGTSLVNSPLQGFVIKMDSRAVRSTPRSATAASCSFRRRTLHALVVDSQGRIVVAGEHIAAGVYTSERAALSMPTARRMRSSAATASPRSNGTARATRAISADMLIVDAGRQRHRRRRVQRLRRRPRRRLRDRQARCDRQRSTRRSATAATRVFHDPGRRSRSINAITPSAATPDGGIALRRLLLHQSTTARPR